MIKVILSAITFLSFNLISIDACAQVVENFPLLRESTVTAFLDGVFNEKPFDTPLDELPLPREIKMYDVWRGNAPELSPAITSLTLNFAGNAPEDLQVTPSALAGKEESVKKKQFSLFFDFKDNNIIVRHSHSLSSRQKGGFKLFDLKKNKAKRFFYRGQGDSGVVLLIPQLAKKNTDRGVLVCPREFKKFENPARAKPIEKRSLLPTGYSIESIKTLANAEVSAKLENLINFVMGKVTLQTSPGLPLPETESDESYSRRVHVHVAYRGDAATQIPPITDYSDFTLGVSTAAELQLSTGYKRRSTRTTTVSVKELQIPHDFTAPMQIADTVGTMLYADLQQHEFNMQSREVIDVNVLAGPCYLVLNHVGPIIHEYLKEPFVLPEKYNIKE